MPHRLAILMQICVYCANIVLNKMPAILVTMKHVVKNR